MRPVPGRVLIGLAVVVMLSSTGGKGASGVGGKMYWTDAGSGEIQRANLDGSQAELQP
jgi:Low-density lipoprotein receptor repeat class B